MDNIDNWLDIKHILGTCDCDRLNMNCWYMRNNDPEFIEYLPEKQEAQIAAHIKEVELEARIALLAKIANTEGWEESAYVYCTEPEIGLSPNEFETVRHKYPNLSELPQPEEDKYLTTPQDTKEQKESNDD